MGWGWLVDLIYPKRCFGCGRGGRYFCEQCREKSEVRIELCPGCGKPSIRGWRHARCGKAMERLIVGLRYRGMVSLGLRRVKFGSSWEVLEELFEWWWQRVGKEFLDLEPQEWVVGWIPMHEKKRRWRGFDQAEVLARKLGERLGFEAIDLLRRVRSTQPQFGLGIRERQKNLRGAFKIKSGAKRMVSKKKVLLVDDIWTTGSTMREGARVLRKSGLREVWGVVVAG